jgi:hypothetical protein
METNEILEGNKLIAEFMKETGLTKVKDDKIVPYDKSYSYNWSIMPVVEKINSDGKFRVRIFFDANGANSIYNCWIEKVEWVSQHLVDERICGRSDIKEPMTVIWKCVVEFIKWEKLND